MLDEGAGFPKKTPRGTGFARGENIAKKEMPTTIDDDKRASAEFSYTSPRYLPGISRISSNIKEYGQSLLEVMGPIPLEGGVKTEELYPGEHLITSRKCLRTINHNQLEADRTIPARTKPFHSHARTKQSLIRMKTRAQLNYCTIFDSNENQSSIKPPNNF